MRYLSATLFVASLVAAGCSSDRQAAASRMRTPATPTAGANTAGTPAGAGSGRIAREVRHELTMLPYYGVFDELNYRVDGNTVTLMGEVTRPTLKSDAENVVKRIEGVDRVVNNIEVLPLSPDDDRIRMAVYRAVYSFPSLNRYALSAVPSIHIIVKNGHVTLAGAAASQADKDAAGLQANSVPGVFSVTNNLQVENR